MPYQIQKNPNNLLYHSVIRLEINSKKNPEADKYLEKDTFE